MKSDTWLNDDLMHEWDFLRRQCYTLPQAAARLGVSRAALPKAILRANRAGDPRAVRSAA